METLLIDGGTVVTQNSERRIYEDGAVLIRDGTIAVVGERDEVTDATDADHVIDASGHAVVPGLINTHTHVSDILLRGRSGTNRGLFDWLWNVKQPGIAAMTAEEYELAAALWATEAIESGITTFVENDLATPLDAVERIERKLDVYRKAGLRSLYARGLRDRPPDDTSTLFERTVAKEPAVTTPPQERYVAEIDEWLTQIESLSETYHGRDGRQEIWLAPGVVEGMTADGLRAAADFAARHDVMTTTHVAETPEQESGPMSSVEYLANIGYLGEHTLLGHCVQISTRDVRFLAETGTTVAHNIATNMRLATGFAPVPSLLSHGVSVGLGTDSAILSDRVDAVADLGLTALAHKGHHRDPGVVSAETVLDMATIEAARAIGRADTLGSLEAGKRADLVLVDMDGTRLTPAPDAVSALTYQASGADVATVICDGEVLLSEGRTALADDYPDLRSRATAAGERLARETGIGPPDR